MASFKHHGIKGQKWGVRNGPPYPIEDKILKKGTRLNSVSSYNDSDEYRNTGRAIYTYRKDEEWDNKVYKGMFANFLREGRAEWFIKEHEFETTKDLRMPTSKERKQAFYDMLEDKKIKEIIKKDFAEELYELRWYDEKLENFDINMNTKKDKDLGYYLLNKRIMNDIDYYESGKIYMEKMKENYDAMVDDNDVNSYNEAHDPIIIFRGDLFLKSVKSRNLTNEEILKNYNYVVNKLEKEGKEWNV